MTWEEMARATGFENLESFWKFIDACMLTSPASGEPKPGPLEMVISHAIFSWSDEMDRRKKAANAFFEKHRKILNAKREREKQGEARTRRLMQANRARDERAIRRSKSS